MSLPAGRPLDVFIVAGEESGDRLGGPLMAALKTQTGGNVRFRGVGGTAMQAEGLESQFPMEDVTAIGFSQVAGKLPLILRRIRETAAAATLSPPDVLLLIDSPDFNHRVARRVRKMLPELPVVKYVSPTVWVWRPGRAKAMRAYVDHILALFPFEPSVHKNLGGPACTYVGHPLLQKLNEMRPRNDAERAARNDGNNPLMLVLPGSRGAEIARLSPVFGETIAKLKAMNAGIRFVLPTLPSKLEQVKAAIAAWPVQPEIVTAEADKYAAFRKARAALAASGTVTLELALAGIPLAAAYRIPAWEAFLIRRMVYANSALLPNIVLGENIVPEFLQADCTADNLSRALARILDNSPERKRQLDGFQRIDGLFRLHAGEPDVLAARTVLELVKTKTGRSF